jgi:cell division protein ZapA (FtsZ GTPase activity inhibitor)
MDDRSISIELAGRAYPLTIQADEEDNIRSAANSINESIARLKGQYPMTDKMDLLAMAALEVTTRAMNQARPQEHAEITEAVAELERSLSETRG